MTNTTQTNHRMKHLVLKNLGIFSYLTSNPPAMRLLTSDVYDLVCGSHQMQGAIV